MRKVIKPVLVTFMLSFATVSVAHDHDSNRVDHFKGLKAQSLVEAFEHITDYNQQLQVLLEGDLTAETMLQVHELTYTLENALHRLEVDLEQWAEQLEELHLASEKFDAGAVKKEAGAYLSLSREWQNWGRSD